MTYRIRMETLFYFAFCLRCLLWAAVLGVKGLCDAHDVAMFRLKVLRELEALSSFNFDHAAGEIDDSFHVENVRFTIVAVVP